MSKMPPFTSPNNYIVNISTEGLRKGCIAGTDDEAGVIEAPVRFESGHGLFDQARSGQPHILNMHSSTGGE